MELGLDPVVLLAPVLVLAVVALLGFAGCGFEGAPAPPGLYFRARVPTGLNVTQVEFGWEAPSTQRNREILEGDKLKPYVDGQDNVFPYSRLLPLMENTGIPVSETWTVRCVVTVEGGAMPGPSASGTATVDGASVYPTFQATGGAADLRLTFTGAS